MEFAKIFKKVDRNSCEFLLIPYNSSEINYADFIKSQRKKGFRQVLFNTELMLFLVKATSKNSDIILTKIKMSEDAEDGTQEELNHWLLQLRTMPDNIYKIISELEWISDKESIDIMELGFLNKNTSSEITIKSNGICIGQKNEKIFDIFVSKCLLRYFYEE
ncbi:hypothetical protein [Enterococcus faecalis]|uniref:hypothetical protein n=1 Tax=Enterococcus faecalis TaxID=1351 RepID=UPI001A06F3C3|nr:hypothetical protein [Enterococcus faecalis]